MGPQTANVHITVRPIQESAKGVKENKLWSKWNGLANDAFLLSGLLDKFQAEGEFSRVPTCNMLLTQYITCPHPSLAYCVCNNYLSLQQTLIKQLQLILIIYGSYIL